MASREHLPRLDPTLRDKRKDLHVAHQKLDEEIKGKTKEEVVELIKSFREANKARHDSVKEAHKELIKSLRDRPQKGARRE